MALISPGVEVSIIDESNYVPAATASVPYILIATAENKLDPSGTGIASGTLASNANNVYLISSQRELINTFGNPNFFQTANGTPVNGFELNEYGLLAAHSVLGISNRAYIQRVDVDLNELTATLVRPTGEAPDNSWWFDIAETTVGIFEWNASTGEFTFKSATYITNAEDLTLGVPNGSVGNPGDYAVVAINANNPVYYKNSSNLWVLVGSDEWKNSWATVQGSETNPTLTTGDTIIVNGITVQVPASPDDTVGGLAAAIESAAITGITAANVNGRLELYVDSTASSDGSTEDGAVEISGTAIADLGIDSGRYVSPELQQSAHTQIPTWRTTNPRPTGSVWHKITPVNQGSDFSIKQYDASTDLWNVFNAPLYDSFAQANFKLDPAGGGRNLPLDTLFTFYDVNETNTLTAKIYRKFQTGDTAITGTEANATLSVSNATFSISASQAGSETLTTPVTVTAGGDTAFNFVEAFSAANVPNTRAELTSTGTVRITHTQGGVIKIVETVGTALSDLGITPSLEGVESEMLMNGDIEWYLSSWQPLEYTASADEPDQAPEDGRKWYYSAIGELDIMVHDGTTWRGYRNVTEDIRGIDLSNTDAAGPIVSTTPPTQQSDGSALEYGDLWLDSSDLENYPELYRWRSVLGVDQWVEIDNTDQTTQDGIVFADARWSTDSTIDPIDDDIATITELLSSDNLDLDAPDPALYPAGTLLFNTRRSGFNVKEYRVDYFNSADFPAFTTENPDAWVTVSGNRDDGSPYMGRYAVRQMVTEAMRAAIDSNTEIREEQRQFNLITAPGYPELIPNMVALNNERNNTAFVIGDTPLRLSSDSETVRAWANGEVSDGFTVDETLITNDPYLGVFYPACQTNDLSGATVVQPASHMMLRTFVRNDNVAFPWLAPAGPRRGTVDNAGRLGYVEASTGEFVQSGLTTGLKDTLYENSINPITLIPASGITNFGNKTTQGEPSALDRINVARLVAFIRDRLGEIGNQFLFEPNDTITRNEIKNAVESLMNDLLAKRGIFDYLVVCDNSNNTPERIDRNELYVDIAIEPVKAVEFIFIPVRIKNTGEISSGNIASSSTI
jgi:hypothetical protein